MHLALVRRKWFVVLLTLASAASWAQSVQSRRVFKVPYVALNEPQESNVYLAVPFVRIGESWSAFSGGKARSAEETALQELLGALYRGDVAAA